MKKVILIIIIVFFLAIDANARVDTASQSKPTLYPGWTLWIPGASHFYDRHSIDGLIFSSLEISGIALGMAFDDKLKSGSSTPYYNYPLLLGMQAYGIDKCHWLRNRLTAVKYYRPDFHYDPMTFHEMLGAPFKPENIFTPITAGLAIVAIGELYLGGRQTHRSFRDVDKMNFAGQYIDRYRGLALYGTVSLGASYGAGIAEEYCFRNGFLPLWDYRYGRTKGLVYSSLLFGMMHFTNLLFSDKPDYGATALQAAEATIAGYFLGKDVQKRNYGIGPAIAAHMWYDFILMIGSFLVDPENNFIGVDIRFKGDF